jgi:hypothetical protein
VSVPFLDLISNITEQMFKFLTQFGSVAKAKGYDISKIDIKISSVRFEPVSLFGVSVPIPKVETPEISLSIETNSMYSQQNT